MDTQTYMSQEVKLVYSEAAQTAIDLGRMYHYRFRVVGSGPVPEKPFYQGAWWFEPVLEPPAGKNILELLNRSGVAYKGIVVAHEVSLVEVPAAKEKEISDFKIASPSIPNDTAWGETIATGLLFMVPLMIELFTQLIMLDPAVIVVFEDDVWVEICFYYE